MNAAAGLLSCSPQPAGTWIPLPDGRELAAKNGVLDKLRPIFDFVAGDRSPPPAPKHATAASSKPRAPRAPAQPRRQPGKNPNDSPMKAATKRSAVYPPAPDYDQMDVSMHDATPDNVTVVSEAFDDFDGAQYTDGSRKRRRLEEQPMTQADKEHQLWADELFDYFMLQEASMDSHSIPPQPPQHADLNRPIDDKGHTALHWAAAMGDMEVVKDLIRRGAAVDVPSKDGETPLMRAVLFTNSYDRQNMDKLAGLLIRTVAVQNWYGSTVFHHISNSTQRKSKYACARYYVDSILDKMNDILGSGDVERILNLQDQHGDTAITIAARNGARKCVRSLIGRGAAVDVPNNHNETADHLIVQLNRRRQERTSNQRQLSSSPFQSDGHNSMGAGGPVYPFMNGLSAMPGLDPMLSQSFAHTSQDGYRSEPALKIMSFIEPELGTKTRALAAAVDAEIAEKEAEQIDAERVLAERQLQIETLRRQRQELAAKESEQLSGIEDDDQLLTDLESHMREMQELLQQEEDDQLRDALSQEEQAQAESSSDDLLNDDEEEQVKQKLQMVKELHELVEQRKNLLKVITDNLSNAGIGDKQPEYKRLITGALNVREEDVENMLPEIVSELEDWQLETGA